MNNYRFNESPVDMLTPDPSRSAARSPPSDVRSVTASRSHDERVREAARAVHAHRFIEALPKGYDTEVRERGATLSVGQKQLLSFARALAHDPARPHPRRGHLVRRHGDGGPHPGRAEGALPGAHRDRDRASALHHPARGRDPRAAQGADPRARYAPGAARPARPVLAALPAPVQGPGAGATLRVRRRRPPGPDRAAVGSVPRRVRVAAEREAEPELEDVGLAAMRHARARRRPAPRSPSARKRTDSVRT